MSRLVPGIRGMALIVLLVLLVPLVLIVPLVLLGPLVGLVRLVPLLYLLYLLPESLYFVCCFNLRVRATFRVCSPSRSPSPSPQANAVIKQQTNSGHSGSK